MNDSIETTEAEARPLPDGVISAKHARTPKQQAHIDIVNRLLQVGDFVTHTRCMGLLEEHIVTGREGEWICGNATSNTAWMARHFKKTGHGATGWTNNISPLNVTHINRVPVECVELLATERRPA